MKNDDLILGASRLAAIVHNGQNRKWGHSSDPYIFHPMRVAGLVALYSMATPEMVAAAWLNTVPFTLIVETPQRLKIGIMKAPHLLFGVFHIKRRTRDNVVYMPSFVSIVVPSHAGLEKGFKMLFEFFKSAAKKFLGRLGLVYPHERFSYPGSQNYRQMKIHVAMIKPVSGKPCFFSSTGGSSANPVSFQDFSLIGFVPLLACGFPLFGTGKIAGFLDFFFSVPKVIGSFDLFLTSTAMTMNSKSAVFALVEFIQGFVQLAFTTFLFHGGMVSNAMTH